MGEFAAAPLCAVGGVGGFDGVPEPVVAGVVGAAECRPCAEPGRRVVQDLSGGGVIVAGHECLDVVDRSALVDRNVGAEVACWGDESSDQRIDAMALCWRSFFVPGGYPVVQDRGDVVRCCTRVRVVVIALEWCAGDERGEHVAHGVPVAVGPVERGDEWPVGR